MKSFDLSRRALTSCLAAALLAGCGGSQPPIGVPGAMMQSRVHQASGSSADLLYVAEDNDSVNVTILTYPQGQPYATISGIGPAWGDCSDKNGNVWVDTLSFTSFEYAHGGTTPIATLQVPNTVLITDCSVDPTTGNLAIINMSPSGGLIDVFQNAQGTPTTYATPFEPFALSYDNQGNLFVDGSSSSETLLLAELPKGAKAIKTITLDKPTHWAGGLEWDGKYIAVVTNDPSRPIGQRQLVERVKVSGSRGTIVSSIFYRDMEPGAFIWIQGSTLIGMTKHGGVGMWPFPKGGLHSKKFWVPGVWTSTVSVAPSQSRVQEVEGYRP